MPVDTKTVKGRRELRFSSIDDILADLEKLNEGKVRALGNWSTGQVLKHLAAVMNGCIDGVPLRAPWWGRIIGWAFKNRILTKPMPPGFRLSEEASRHLIFGDVPWDEGVRALRSAIHRLKTESERMPSPFMGILTREEWDQFHCRHSELHLSFLIPDTTTP